MGPLEYLEPMHALFLNFFLHVQMHVHDVITLMEVEKDLKPFWKISSKLKHGP